MTAAAQTAGQPPVTPASRAAAVAWALVARRLRGDVTADLPPLDRPGLVLGYLVEIAASALLAREHDRAGSWERALAQAAEKAEASAAAAEAEPEPGILAAVAGASALRRPAAVRTVRPAAPAPPGEVSRHGTGPSQPGISG